MLMLVALAISMQQICYEQTTQLSKIVQMFWGKWLQIPVV